MQNGKAYNISPIRYGRRMRLNLVMGLILIAMIFLSSSNIYFRDIYGQKTTKSSPQKSPLSANVAALSKASPAPASPKGKIPTIVNKKDSQSLSIQRIFRGLVYPSNMAFIGPNDILVTEKTNGTVMRIVNGTMLKEPLLDVNVAVSDERGMLGIAVSKDSKFPRYVFVYFTESQTKDGDDLQGKKPIGNFLYRYELDNNKLVNGKLLLQLPAVPGPHHNAGKVLIGPDNNVYVVIGDVDGSRTYTQNVGNGPPSDGTSVIYRITQDAKPVGNGILGATSPINKYYAYGIRNSFGMDFDPLTKKLWNTENGPGFGDEINLVEPGFNSGWVKVQGFWIPQTYFGGPVASTPPAGLVDFGGKGKYSPPEFVWNQTVGVTAIKFLNSAKLGQQYQNTIFVGDINNGNIYHFDLNKNRTSLLLNGLLADKIANTAEERNKIVFANGFAGISDIEVSPYDGYLYILTFHKSQGSIYRIGPHTTKSLDN
jgi:aldose sugar dehydrogenase